MQINKKNLDFVKKKAAISVAELLVFLVYYSVIHA